MKKVTILFHFLLGLVVADEINATFCHFEMSGVRNLSISGKYDLKW
jgi:hypothetical protein